MELHGARELLECTFVGPPPTSLFALRRSTIVLRFGTASLFVHSLQTRAARKLDDCAGALNLGPPPIGQVCDRFWGCRAGRSANLPCITNSETCHKLSISLFVMHGRFAERPAIPKKGRNQSSPHTDSQRLGKCLVWEWLSPVPAP